MQVMIVEIQVGNQFVALNYSLVTLMCGGNLWSNEHLCRNFLIRMQDRSNGKGELPGDLPHDTDRVRMR